MDVAVDDLHAGALIILIRLDARRQPGSRPLQNPPQCPLPVIVERV